MLNDKQLRFCQEYIIDLNATQAAKRAGYSEDTATEQGSRLLTNAKIQQEVSHLQEERAKRTQITADKVVVELAKVGFSNIQDYLEDDNKFSDAKGLEKDKAAAIESIQVTETVWDGGTKTSIKFKLHDKIAALEKIGRHLGIFEKDNEQSKQVVRISVSPKEKVSATDKTL